MMIEVKQDLLDTICVNEAHEGRITESRGMLRMDFPPRMEGTGLTPGRTPALIILLSFLLFIPLSLSLQLNRAEESFSKRPF